MINRWLLVLTMVLSSAAFADQQSCGFAHGKNLELFKGIQVLVVRLSYSPETREITDEEGKVYFPTTVRTAQGVLFQNKRYPDDPIDNFYVVIRQGRIQSFTITNKLMEAAFTCPNNRTRHN